MSYEKREVKSLNSFLEARFNSRGQTLAARQPIRFGKKRRTACLKKVLNIQLIILCNTKSKLKPEVGRKDLVNANFETELLKFGPGETLVSTSTTAVSST